jgi:hypothetical protein
MRKKEPPRAVRNETSIIEFLLRPGAEENLHLDFKRAGKNDRALETVCAFANTEGGMLVIGVEDPKKAQGEEQIRAWVDMELLVPVDPASAKRDRRYRRPVGGNDQLSFSVAPGK